jgi:hypothetical protein
MSVELPPEDYDGEDDCYVTHTFPFADRVQHWTGGVNDAMMISVQNAIIVESAKKMNSQLEKKTEDPYLIIHKAFIENAQALLDAGVVSAAQHAMHVKKIFRSQTNTLDPKAVRDKFLVIKEKIGNRLIPHLPLDYRKLGSGKGIRDAFNKLMHTIYVQMNPKKMAPHDLLDVSLNDVPISFRFGKTMPANCILALMTNYVWAGLAKDAAAAIKVVKPKSRATIKSEIARDKNDRADRKSDTQLLENKRTRVNSKVQLFQKSQLNKAFIVASQQPAWHQQARVYKDALEVMSLIGGGDDGRVLVLREKLLCHTLAGPPQPLATPEQLRKAHQEVVDLDDDNTAIFASTQPASNDDASTLSSVRTVMNTSRMEIEASLSEEEEASTIGEAEAKVSTAEPLEADPSPPKRSRCGKR